MLLYGLGGQGKSTLAHRLRQRWLQRSARHQAVVAYGALDEPLLLRKLANGLVDSQDAREALNSRDALRFRLAAALTRCTEQLLIILDNFEDNFEQTAGALRLVDGRPLLASGTVQLLDDLCFALQRSNDQGQEHRLLITSRYRPAGQWTDALVTHQLERLNDEAVQKKVSRLAAQKRRPATGDQPQLRQRAIQIADGNPRLLEWLFALLAQEASATPAMDLNMDTLLAQMAARETALRENILAANLLAAQTPACRQMLARGLICELPVPAGVFDALDHVGPTCSTPNPNAPAPPPSACSKPQRHPPTYHLLLTCASSPRSSLTKNNRPPPSWPPPPPARSNPSGGKPRRRIRARRSCWNCIAWRWPAAKCSLHKK